MCFTGLHSEMKVALCLLINTFHLVKNSVPYLLTLHMIDTFLHEECPQVGSQHVLTFVRAIQLKLAEVGSLVFIQELSK